MDSDDSTSLHLAYLGGSCGCSKNTLPDFGAAVADCMNSSKTVLHLAGLNGHAKLVGVLILYGLSKSACSNTFHHACYSGHSDAVEKLVSECGCDVNASNCSMVKQTLELSTIIITLWFLGHNMLRIQQIISFPLEYKGSMVYY